MDCLVHNSHLLIEKPATHSLESIETLIAKAQTKKQCIAVSHTEQFNPVMLAFKKRLEQNNIGDIKSISTHRSGPLPPQIQDANILIDLAIHDAVIIGSLMTNDPTHIYGASKKVCLKDREDLADIIIQYPNCLAKIHVNWLSQKPKRTCQIITNLAIFELNLLDKTLNEYPIGQNQAINHLIQVSDPLNTQLSTLITSIREKKQPKNNLLSAKKALNIILNPSINSN